MVKTELLDNIVPKGAPIHFIKIDVEGGELGVLKGALEIIKKHQPVIVFEHGRGAADYYGTGHEDVYDLLAGQCGLRLFLMADWLAMNGSASLNREAFLEQYSLGNEWYYMAARRANDEQRGLGARWYRFAGLRFARVAGLLLVSGWHL
jgi:hypothetical protein